MPKSKKILLVEDDPMVVRLYKRKLTMEGFDLVLAYNGEEGLAALKESRPDIVLLDVMMPRLSGLDVLRMIKADPQYKDLPVVILTNLGDRAEDVKKFKELGAEDYWIKANMKLENILKRIVDILKKHDNK